MTIKSRKTRLIRNAIRSKTWKKHVNIYFEALKLICGIFKIKNNNIIKMDLKEETDADPDCIYLTGHFRGEILWII
jgi:hypothetical protein